MFGVVLQLDEKVSVDSVDRAVSYVRQLYSMQQQQPSSETTGEVTVLTDAVRVLLSASDALALDVSRAKLLMRVRKL